MSANVGKHIDLEERFVMYGENGYFIDPLIIKTEVVNELKLSMSYNEIKKFISEADITISPEEIQEFMINKMIEEDPDLKERLAETSKFVGTINLNGSEKEVKAKLKDSKERLLNMLSASKYQFEPDSLEYFKKYVSILKEKCETLIDIMSDLDKCKSGQIDEEGMDRLLDLDFHLSENGEIHFNDANRLADAIIHNVKDLYEKVNLGNNCETYLTFKDSRHQLMKDDMFGYSRYPRKEVQIKDLYYANRKEFIALSKKQEKELEEGRLEDIEKRLANIFHW